MKVEQVAYTVVNLGIRFRVEFNLKKTTCTVTDGSDGSSSTFPMKAQSAEEAFRFIRQHQIKEGGLI